MFLLVAGSCSVADASCRIPTRARVVVRSSAAVVRSTHGTFRVRPYPFTGTVWVGCFLANGRHTKLGTALDYEPAGPSVFRLAGVYVGFDNYVGSRYAPGRFELIAVNLRSRHLARHLPFGDIALVDLAVSGGGAIAWQGEQAATLSPDGMTTAPAYGEIGLSDRSGYRVLDRAPPKQLSGPLIRGSLVRWTKSGVPHSARIL